MNDQKIESISDDKGGYFPLVIVPRGFKHGPDWKDRVILLIEILSDSKIEIRAFGKVTEDAEEIKKALLHYTNDYIDNCDKYIAGKILLDELSGKQT